jgi:hypothetical protein
MIGSKPIENGDNSFSRAILWNPRPFFACVLGPFRRSVVRDTVPISPSLSFDAVGKV